jgi:DNA polymerase III delta prime subunit
MIPGLILTSNLKQREQYAQKILSEMSLNQNSADVLWFEEDSKLGKSEAKKIIEFLKTKPYSGKHKAVIVISAENLTAEAQNALLKTLEEHPQNVLILLFAISEDALLPTIVSRSEITYLRSDSGQSPEKYYQDIEKLVAKSLEERFKYLEKLEEKEDFLQALTSYFHQKQEKNNLSFLKDLLEAERFAKHNVNLRAILEYLMLRLPV